MKSCEFIVFMRKGAAKPIHDRSCDHYFRVKNISGRDKLHPTQKPVTLLKELIVNSSLPGDVVLDPFMGAASTGVAALAAGRKFTGIEIDSGFFELGRDRLKSALQQGDLWPSCDDDNSA